MGANKAD